MRYSEDHDILGVSNLCDVTRRQSIVRDVDLAMNVPGFVYLIEKLAHQHAQNATFGLFAAARLLGFTGWFYIHFFIYLRQKWSAEENSY